MDIYSPLTDIVITYIVYINETNPYTPLVSIQHRYYTYLYYFRMRPGHCHEDQQ